jgi:ankyrin repeat protein
MVRLLVVEFGANANIKEKNGETALHPATRAGHIEIMRLLVVNGRADPNVTDNKFQTPLFLAAEKGHIEEMRVLVVELGANTDSKALHTAVENGRVDTVRLLTDELGADVNAKDSRGWTPLHKAIMSGEIIIISLLTAKTTLRELNFICR